MSLKLKAAIQTLSIIGFITLLVFGLQALAEIVSPRQIGTMIGSFLIAWLAYIMYLILLNRLEYEQKIEQINKG